MIASSELVDMKWDLLEGLSEISGDELGGHEKRREGQEDCRFETQRETAVKVHQSNGDQRRKDSIKS
ncbi:hypothetical protein QJS04_geneDACA004356 [Acorus gramineus]|uniref:Uncharacterized protein n=1 Tax=Acorus gramineus TaxID=55184 RepID=A0AAV9B171_ACOGR|nr:hypothetical protein QJS04_geneDACA004356 [Acorus gramineus]